jgi:hypothetical protein
MEYYCAARVFYGNHELSLLGVKLPARNDISGLWEEEVEMLLRSLVSLGKPHSCFECVRSSAVRRFIDAATA